jgi:mRNA turnover protein 4
MPKSKRNKVVALTKTKEKGQALKSDVIKELRDSIEEFEYIYVFTVENMRNSKLKDLRVQWRHSRYNFASTSLSE